MIITTLSTLLWLACVSISTVSATGQEVEGSGSETSEGAVFSNADYVELIAPLTSKVGVNTYGFYLGNLGVNIALAEVPIALQKHLLLTPSYLYVNVPPSGLSLLTTRVRRVYRQRAPALGVGWP